MAEKSFDVGSKVERDNASWQEKSGRKIEVDFPHGTPPADVQPLVPAGGWPLETGTEKFDGR